MESEPRSKTRIVVWIIGIALNALPYIILMNTYLLIDSIFQIIGRVLGAIFLSFLALLPLALFKKNQFRKKALPYLFVLISFISLLGSM